jgi:hypothetical protein
MILEAGLRTRQGEAGTRNKEARSGNKEEGSGKASRVRLCHCEPLKALRKGRGNLGGAGARVPGLLRRTNLLAMTDGIAKASRPRK